MIVVNSPNNPGTSVLVAPTISSASPTLTRGTDILIVGDEVYEHMVYDGARHESLARNAGARRAEHRHRLVRQDLPRDGLEGRLRAGAARDQRRDPPRPSVHRVHRQQPVQHALAEFLREPARYEGLPSFFTAKRDLFRSALADTPLDLLPCRGSYFQLARYDRGQRRVSAGLCAAAGDGDRRRRHSAVGVLSGRDRSSRDPLLLRQARRHAACRGRAIAPAASSRSPRIVTPPGHSPGAASATRFATAP